MCSGSDDEKPEEEGKRTPGSKSPITAKARTAGTSKRPRTCGEGATSPWIRSVEAPSIVITSKNATKAVSLSNNTFASCTRAAAYYATKYGQAFRALEAESRHDAGQRKVIKPAIARIQNFTMANTRAVVSRVGTAVPERQRNSRISRNGGNNRARSKALPAIPRGPDEANFSPEDCLTKSSANFKMLAEHTTCAPTININIKSVNINSPGFGEEYRSFHQQQQRAQSKRRTPRGASRVLAAIPRHDESPALQRLFATSNKYQQEKDSEFYRRKKRARIGATLTELLVGSAAPLNGNLRDYVIAHNRPDNASFRLAGLEARLKNQSPHRSRGSAL